MAKPSKLPDVRQLNEQSLSALRFPAERTQDFRAHFAADIHEQIAKHAAQDTSVEICGVLVGQWGRDEDGPFVMISDLIRCDSANSQAGQVTFTHGAWVHISREMDTRFVDRSIVGWYHSHPDFGIFLSERDHFVHEHFFSEPGQIAYVVDPVRDTEGLFAWRDGKPVLCSHYWVGDQVHSQREMPREEAPGSSHGEAGCAAPIPTPTDPKSPSFGRVVNYAAIFFIGYLLASLTGSWHQRRMIEGAVAHYGIWKGLRPGLEEHVDAVEAELTQVATVLRRLETAGEASAGDEKASQEGDWQSVREQLGGAQELLASMKTTYCLDAVEAATILRIVAAKLAEIEGQRPAAGESPSGPGVPKQPSGPAAAPGRDSSQAAETTKGDSKIKGSEPETHQDTRSQDAATADDAGSDSR